MLNTNPLRPARGQLQQQEGGFHHARHRHSGTQRRAVHPGMPGGDAPFGATPRPGRRARGNHRCAGRLLRRHRRAGRLLRRHDRVHPCAQRGHGARRRRRGAAGARRAVARIHRRRHGRRARLARHPARTRHRRGLRHRRRAGLVAARRQRGIAAMAFPADLYRSRRPSARARRQPGRVRGGVPPRRRVSSPRLQRRRRAGAGAGRRRPHRVVERAAPRGDQCTHRRARKAALPARSCRPWPSGSRNRRACRWAHRRPARNP
jgi:hypothetical protein